MLRKDLADLGIEIPENKIVGGSSTSVSFKLHCQLQCDYQTLNISCYDYNKYWHGISYEKDKELQRFNEDERKAKEINPRVLENTCILCNYQVRKILVSYGIPVEMNLIGYKRINDLQADIYIWGPKTLLAKNSFQRKYVEFLRVQSPALHESTIGVYCVQLVATCKLDGCLRKH